MMQNIIKLQHYNERQKGENSSASDEAINSYAGKDDVMTDTTHTPAPRSLLT
jgi:hypothetical protein